MVGVEVEQHGAKGGEGSWGVGATQGGNKSATRSLVIDVQPIKHTGGVCCTTERPHVWHI